MQHPALSTILNKNRLETLGYRLIGGQYVRPDSNQFPPAKPAAAEPEKKAKPKKGPSELAMKFDAIWKALHGPDLTPEYKFHGERRWRFDYVHLPTMTAIELEGGVFLKQGYHSSGKGIQGDCEKYNAAATLGYFVFRLATGQVTGERVKQIIHAIQSRALNTVPT